MFKVLHVMYGADAGGISSVVLNYYRVLAEKGFQFDLALTSGQRGLNAESFCRLGSTLYGLPQKSDGLKNFEKELASILCDGKYDAIHVHQNETSYVALRVAKKCGISVRIAHSHTTSPCCSLKDELRRLSGCCFNQTYATHLVACGKFAGERVFGRRCSRSGKVIFLPNAINADRFAYDASVRKEVRSSLGLDDAFVVGMVGRLDQQKNYELALQIARCLDRDSRVRVVVAGNGPLNEEIASKISSYDIKDRFILLGRRNDVDRLYQAFDVFMLTSLYEGFPVVGIEAAASGLPILVSKTVTPELGECGEVTYLPLGNPIAWVEEINRLSNAGATSRGNRAMTAGFDINSNWRTLADVYLGRC